jgi:hypothetical protein
MIPRKSRRWLVLGLLFLFLLGLVYLALNLVEKRGKSDAGAFDFALADTNLITKIEIRDAFGQTITLKNTKEGWQDEKGRCVAAPNVSFILDAAKNIEFKGYLPEKSKQHITKLMATQHIRVRFYTEDEWEKTWYIGPPAQDHYGQIMLLETADDGKGNEPVMMRIRGMNGIISPRFFADRKKWMCTSVFAYTPEQIEYVEVINREVPDLSFKVQRLPRSFQVSTQGKRLSYLDTNNVYRYLQEFRNVHFNMANLELNTAQCDSVKKSPVYCELVVKPKTQAAIKLRLYRIASATPQRNEMGVMENWDMNLFWAVLPSGELVKCQYFVFNPLLMGHIYFPAIQERK